MAASRFFLRQPFSINSFSFPCFPGLARRPVSIKILSFGCFPARSFHSRPRPAAARVAPWTPGLACRFFAINPFIRLLPSSLSPLSVLSGNFFRLKSFHLAAYRVALSTPGLVRRPLSIKILSSGCFFRSTFLQLAAARVTPWTPGLASIKILSSGCFPGRSRHSRSCPATFFN